jgi:hypothetical protein
MRLNTRVPLPNDAPKHLVVASWQIDFWQPEIKPLKAAETRQCFQGLDAAHGF